MKGIGEIIKMARRVEVMIYDITLDASFTPGQQLTALKMIKRTLIQTITACEESIRRRTRTKRKAKGGSE